MIIDLRKIDHEQVIERQKLNRIRFKLRKMTVAKLRDFARRYHIPLAGASTKEQLTLVTCANDDYGHGYRRVVICHPIK